MGAFSDLRKTLLQAAEPSKVLLNLVTDAIMLYMVNGLQTPLDAIEDPDELVSDTPWSKKRFQLYMELAQAFAKWAKTPLPGSGMTPAQIIYLREKQ